MNQHVAHFMGIKSDSSSSRTIPKGKKEECRGSMAPTHNFLFREESKLILFVVSQTLWPELWLRLYLDAQNLGNQSLRLVVLCTVKIAFLQIGLEKV